jgi:hypothetical protein
VIREALISEIIFIVEGDEEARVIKSVVIIVNMIRSEDRLSFDSKREYMEGCISHTSVHMIDSDKHVIISFLVLNVISVTKIIGIN